MASLKLQPVLSAHKLLSAALIGISVIVAGTGVWTLVFRLVARRAFRKYISTEPAPTDLVKSTTSRVEANAKDVSINKSAILQLIQSLGPRDLAGIKTPDAFDSSKHLVSSSQAVTAQYLLVVDALNFCFWPVDGLEYEHLSTGLRNLIQTQGPQVVSASRLASITAKEVRSFFGWKSEIHNEQERARLVREVGCGLLRGYGGQAENLIRAAKGSANELIRLITRTFPGFRDEALYQGQQVFFYKRAQIFVADVYGAFGGKGLGLFRDIGQLTMFADYRVPQVLQLKGVLVYRTDLRALLQDKRPVSNEQEVEIRAATVQAVEKIKQAIAQKHGVQAAPLAIHLDWWLWEMGERQRAEAPLPHHRFETVFY